MLGLTILVMGQETNQAIQQIYGRRNTQKNEDIFHKKMIMIKKTLIIFNIIIIFSSCITRKEMKMIDAKFDRHDSIANIINQYKSEKYLWHVIYDTLDYDSMFICYYSNVEIS